MEAIIQFNLNEANEREAHLRCVKALDMALTLNDVAHLQRSYLKYQNLSNEEEAIATKIFTDINTLFEANNISLDELLS